MKFSYNWLQDYIQQKLPSPQKLAELLMFRSFEVEEVVKVGKDWTLDIKVLPNRAHDCLSYIGIAKEIAAILKLKIKNYFKIKNLKLKIQNNGLLSIKIENPKDCIRYTGVIMNGVKVGESPKWMQERLVACGLQPINNIVDITNYVMLEIGQPLHAFDLDKLTAKQIVVRRAKKGESIKTLDKENTVYKLDETILVIADKEKPIAIAGIKGGVDTAINKNTKNIIIEAANFNSVLIRRASQKLKLRTDASWRFENNISPQIIDLAQDRVAGLVQQIANGKIAGGLVEVYSKKPALKIIKLGLEAVKKLLGVEIPAKKVKSILESLGFKIKKADTQSLIVEIPFVRLDVETPEDLIEEVGRIFGYENISSLPPKARLISPIINEEILWLKKSKVILKETGFCEAYNSSFIAETDKQIFSYNDGQLLVLENSISVLNKYLRPSLIPNLLKNVKDNFRFFDEVKLFEFGHTFKPIGDKKVLEGKMISGALGRKTGKEELFFELKGAVESLFEGLGINSIWFDSANVVVDSSLINLFHPAKTAEIKAGDKILGFLGEIHPAILEAMGIDGAVFVFDLDFEKLATLATNEKEYLPISVFPAVLRDLAVIVPLGTKVFEIEQIITMVGGDLIDDIDLFDIYAGEEMGEGKENLAFHIVYQAQDRNLSSEEINKIHQNIISELEKNPNCNWEVRK